MQNKEISCNIQNPHFNFIKTGNKKYEVRLDKGKWKNVSVGDFLIIDNLPESEDIIKIQILSVERYKNYREMLIDKGYENVIPDANSLDEAEAAYYKFYTKEDELAFGVIAFGIKVL